MNTLLSLLLLTGVLVAVQGVDTLTGGEVYLAYLRQLAQTSESIMPPPLPPPLPPMTSTEPTQSVPPPPPAEPLPTFEPRPSTAPSYPSSEGVQPPLIPPSFNYEKPMPPPPPPTSHFEGQMPPPVREGQMMAPVEPPRMPPPPGTSGNNYRMPPPPGMPRNGNFSQPRGAGGFLEPLPRGGASDLERPHESKGGFFESLPSGGSSDLEHQSEFGDEGGEDQEEPISPAEIQQIKREVQQLKAQIKSILSQARKLQEFSADVSSLNEISSNLDALSAALANAISDPAGTREAIQEYRDEEYWNILNEIRAKLEIPKEIKRHTASLRRLEKVLQVKNVGTLGLDLDLVRALVSEMKQALSNAQSQFAAGNIEEAKEAMQVFYENSPGDIEGVIYQIRDVKNRLNKIKDTSIRSQVDQILQEVVSAFNAGEYRDAREVMNQYFKELMQIIDQAIKARGSSRNFDRSKINALRQSIEGKLQQSGEGEQ